MIRTGYSADEARRELMRVFAELDYSFFKDGNVYHAEGFIEGEFNLAWDNGKIVKV